MKAQKDKAYAFIDGKKDEMLELWKELVNTESGSSYKEGVDAVAEKLRGVLIEEGVDTRIHSFENAGNMVIGNLGQERNKDGIIFLGHMDTVFPVGTVAKRPFKIEDGKAYGPGVLDMKGGIVALIYAVKALNHIGYTERPIKVILAGDEEVAHANTNSIEVITNEAKGNVATFCFETGYIDDGIVVGRKGSADFVMEVKGIAAHAGNAPEKGRSAILELSHKIIDIQALTNFEEGTTFNVGTIVGGTVSNAVPDYAKAVIDVRFLTQDKAEIVTNQLKEIASKTYVEGTTTTLTVAGAGFMPMETTEGVKKLFELVKNTSLELGLNEPYPKKVGGGSDASVTVGAGVPTVCAVGVKGFWNHSSQEYAVVDTLFERVKLIVASVLNLN